MKKILTLFNLDLGALAYGLKCFRPATIDISRSAKIDVAKNSLLNMGWSAKRIWKNKTPCEITAAENSTLKIGESVRIRPGFTLSVNKDASLEIGERTAIGKNTRIDTYDKIKIGKGCLISEDVIIRDSSNHQIIGSDSKTGITIEDNVWIGIRAIILPGVKIGEGSVVGAGSIVTRDVPPKSLVVGAPAKTIKENIKWER